MVLAEKKRYAKQPTGRPRKRKTTRRVQQRRKILTYLQVTAIILSCFGFGLFYIYKNNQITALGYRVEDNRQKVAVLQRDFKQLELEAAELQCPDRVEEVATKKLGMDKPDSILLATLPLEDKVSDQKENASKNQDKKEKKSWSVALKRFIGRAEASPH